MNVIIPMAGLGSRFSNYGFSINKYLLPVDINKIKMIEKAILTLNIPKSSQFIFILREETGADIDLRNYLSNLCQEHSYNCIILSVNYLTEGPTSTAYLAKEYVNNDLPLIISNSDQILDWDFKVFIKKVEKYDGAVLTYTPDYELIIGAYDKHSFVRFDENTENPVEFIEKTVISNQALVGVHYYKKGSYFVKSAENLFTNDIRAPNGEFYLSYTYQALLDMGYSIGTHCLSDKENFYPVGEPDDYFKYYNSTASFFHTDISNDLVLDEYDFFSISYGKKGETCKMENVLFIPFTGGRECFVLNEYTFDQDTYYLQVFDIIHQFGIVDITQYTRGWLIGDFEPSIKKTKEYEIGLLKHYKDEKWQFHFHAESREINILVSGEMILNNIRLFSGTIFIFEKNMIACPIFLTDCIIICIKVPSIPSDKYII